MSSFRTHLNMFIFLKQLNTLSVLTDPQCPSPIFFIVEIVSSEPKNNFNIYISVVVSYQLTDKTNYLIQSMYMMESFAHMRKEL